MLTSTVIDAAQEKRYSEFSNAIKQELHSKLNGHEDVINYVQQLDSIRSMKSAFAEINNAS